MNQNITVNTFDELLNAGIDSITGKIDPELIEFGNDLVLKVRIKGEHWDGTIDYRGAQYIIELQKAVNRLMIEASGSDEPLRDISKYITVKVRVTEGSSFYEIIIKDTLKKMTEKINGKQATFLIALSILTVGGYFTTGRLLDYRKSLEEKALQNKAEQTLLQELAPIIKQSLTIIEKADLEKPARTIVSRLKEDDSIVFPGQDEMTADEAKQQYPKKPKVVTEYGTFDDNYRITNIDISEVPPEFTVILDGFKFKAKAELSEQNVDDLTNGLKTSMKNGTDFNIDLQVYVTYNKREFKKASITGIGPKRQASKDLKDLIKTWE